MRPAMNCCRNGHDLDVHAAFALNGALNIYRYCRECNRIRARQWRLDNKDRTYRVRRPGSFEHGGRQLRPEFKGP
jgi:hypothetical protein